ncbi:MAG: DUF4838 domain-containing protein [Oscillospiraceae bacterium]|nr:DUF4838 domain-containing protein [Oscillospiraceae bacterium]
MLAKNGKALLKIWIAEDASPGERYAASELRHYLNLMTAAPFAVTTDKPTEPAIAVGAAAESLGIVCGQNPGGDAFTIRTTGGGIGITGGKRGVIYGVYELLESLGCRFFTPTCEKIPCVPELPLPQLDITQKPVLEYRWHNYKDMTGYPRFAVKSRLNGTALPEEYGGGVTYAWFVHSFERDIIHPDDYFDGHPEYFALVNGKRLRDFGQLCLTNPEVLEITVEKARAALRKNPECRIISVSQNDCENYCTCPSCAAIDDREESHAGSLIWFVNQVAERLEEEFPEVIIDTLAYMYSRRPPKSLRPRHNVCVRLCSIECCFTHSFESCDETGFLHDLRDWAKVCNRLYIWDYTTGFAHYPAPHPNWNVLQPNMRSFITNNVKGVFEQACGALGGSTDLNELRAYLISKLLWDADCDIEAHKREFAEYYYGAAAEHILRYIDLLTEMVERDGLHTGFNDNCDREYLSDAMLDVYADIFQKAEQAVAGDALRLTRVAKAGLSIRWVRMKNRQMLQNSIDPQEMNRFFADWRAHGLTRIDEWVSAETTLHALLEGKWRGTEFYRHWSAEGREKL